MKNSKRKQKSGMVPYRKQLDEFGNVTNGPTKENPIVPFKIPAPTEETLKLRAEEKEKNKKKFADWEEFSRENIKANIARLNEKKAERAANPRVKTPSKKIASDVVYEKGKTYKSTKKYTPKFKSL